MAKDPQPFDFREHAALDDTAVSFRNWVSKSSSFFSDFWLQASDYEAQLTTGKMGIQTYSSILADVSRDDLCCIAMLRDHSRTVWHASPTDLRLICSEMLGAEVDAEMEGKELTAVEFELSQMFLTNLAESLGFGWMGPTEVAVELGELNKDPRKISAFRQTDLLTQTSILVEMKSGTANVHWLLPNQSTRELLATVIDRRQRGEPASFSAEVVGQLPIEMVVELGRANIPVNELSTLEVGQLITLNQRIDRPLRGYIDNDAFCECWPGQIGKQQALEISRTMKTETKVENNE